MRLGCGRGAPSAEVSPQGAAMGLGSHGLLTVGWGVVVFRGSVFLARCGPSLASACHAGALPAAMRAAASIFLWLLYFCRSLILVSELRSHLAFIRYGSFFDVRS